MSQKGTFGKITKDGETRKCIYVIWHTKDPVNTWYVNSMIDGQIARCRLISLLDRRPHEVNGGFTQDAWSFDVLDERTFQKMAGGGVPIPPRNL